jgi:hypothetical protein
LGILIQKHLHGKKQIKYQRNCIQE